MFFRHGRRGTLDRCTVQDMCRKFARDCVAITPTLQSAHIIAPPSDAHDMLSTLEVMQMQPVAPPTLQVPILPSGSSASFSQIARPRNNVQEYNKAYDA